MHVADDPVDAVMHDEPRWQTKLASMDVAKHDAPSATTVTVAATHWCVPVVSQKTFS